MIFCFIISFNQAFSCHDQGKIGKKMPVLLPPVNHKIFIGDKKPLPRSMTSKPEIKLAYVESREVPKNIFLPNFRVNYVVNKPQNVVMDLYNDEENWVHLTWLSSSSKNIKSYVVYNTWYAENGEPYTYIVAKVKANIHDIKLSFDQIKQGAKFDMQLDVKLRIVAVDKIGRCSAPSNYAYYANSGAFTKKRFSNDVIKAIPYYIDNSVQLKPFYMNLIQNSFKEINNLKLNVGFKQVFSKDDAKVVIMGVDHDEYIAYVRPTYGDNDELLHLDFVFNYELLDSKPDLATTASLHEMLHCFGMNHQVDAARYDGNTSIMSYIDSQHIQPLDVKNLIWAYGFKK